MTRRAGPRRRISLRNEAFITVLLEPWLFRISQDVTVRNQVFLKKPGFCPRFPGIW